ncbi:magnesium transporter MgtE N-terminal domain-containing protein [Pseudarthrobacter defluvii]|uniref:magnesium transporter MgtE N-terminal domain-containing protein n=1 Tax=Pseudarthrobacter defluvii TaxID=410837 RepID=UPI0025749A55|nr:CBS domain-containing protein [Pseudarthrobacter defluvii]WJH26848.1 magnesium transporter [Pseudarthrobacter defluvii]
MTTAAPTATQSLSTLLRQPVTDVDGHRMGTLADLIVRLRHGDYPLLTGLVVAVGNTRVFVAATNLAVLESTRVQLAVSTGDVGEFRRRDGEVLLSEDVLGHRLIDVSRAAFVKAYDIYLTPVLDGWAATGLDVHRRRWLSLGSRHAAHPQRDWKDFEPLIGHAGSAQVRAVTGRIPALKPAQIADIIEEATGNEQNELLAEVHKDPELEADVFEELDEDSQSELFRDRTDAEVAEVLGRMQADDAADALMDLPQERRSPVLDLLPEPHRAVVHRLLGYHGLTAGGLMGTDFLALPSTATIADALTAVRGASLLQPQALSVIYTLAPDGKLEGTLSLVHAVQADPATTLGEVADHDLVCASPGDDVIDVTTRMADFNLLAMPVIAEDRRIIGSITVDDALEAAIPEDWSRRESNHHETGREG